MIHLTKLGGIAAFINAMVAMATLGVIIFMIGFPAIADSGKFIDLVMHHPMPFLIADGLKLISAALSIVIILAVANFLQRDAPSWLSAATGLGFLSVLSLIGNALLSLYGISQTYISQTYISQAYGGNPGALGGHDLQTAIQLLAIAAVGLDGLWRFAVSWIGLKQQQLPRLLGYLGMGMGLLSLVPPLGIPVLILSLVWSVWMGQVLFWPPLG
jgi:hypothetical protein